MGVEGVVLLVAPEGEGYEEVAYTPHAKENFDLDRKGIVSVVAVGVAGAAACLGLYSISAVPLVSSSSSKQNSLSAREVGANLDVTIITVTSCKFKL